MIGPLPKLRDMLEKATGAEDENVQISILHLLLYVEQTVLSPG